MQMNTYSTSDNKIYNNTGNAEVLKLVGNTGRVVLDIGCGAGDNANALKRMGKEVDGVSISTTEISIAEKYLRNAYVYNLENGLPPNIPDNTYDVVICSHVLEHIGFPQSLMKDLKRVLKPSGILIVALPNVFYYRFRLQLLLGEFKTADSGIWDYTHLRWYSFRSAGKLLMDHNFEIVVATVSGEMPFSRLLRHVLPKGWRETIYKLLTKISKGLFGFQLVYKAANIK